MGNCSANRHTHTWKIQLGPFAQHTIRLYKKYHFGKYIELSVDGSTLVHGCAADLGCNGEWRCKFRFIGERAIDFDIHETDADGNPLDTRARVTKRSKYIHECEVVVGNNRDLSAAELLIDGISFRALPQRAAPRQEEQIQMSVQALQQAYGVVIPFKVKEEACEQCPGGVCG